MRRENVYILIFSSNCTNKLQLLDLSIYWNYKRQLKENLRVTNWLAFKKVFEKLM